MNPKQVSYIAIDSAAYYVGKNSGMIERIKIEESFGSADFCHKVEMLLQNTMPKWVADTLDSCRSIAAFVNEHSTVKNHLHEYVNIEDVFIFTVIPTMCETRFAQFLNLHLEGILKNIKLLVAALASLQVNPFLHDKIVSVLRFVTSNTFVSKMLIICETYKRISVLEKEAQLESLGAFQYLSLKDRLMELLSQKTLPDPVQNLLSKSTSEISGQEDQSYLNFDAKDNVDAMKKKLEVTNN